MSGGKIGSFLIFDSMSFWFVSHQSEYPESSKFYVLSYQKTFTHDSPWPIEENPIGIRKSSFPEVGFAIVDSPDGARIDFLKENVAIYHGI